MYVKGSELCLNEHVSTSQRQEILSRSKHIKKLIHLNMNVHSVKVSQSSFSEATYLTVLTHDQRLIRFTIRNHNNARSEKKYRAFFLHRFVTWQELNDSVLNYVRKELYSPKLE